MQNVRTKWNGVLCLLICIVNVLICPLAVNAGENDPAQQKSTYVLNDMGNLQNENQPVALAAQVIPEERMLPRLVDDADLLTDSEEEEIGALLDEISERQQFDVAVVTVYSLEGKTPEAYADDFYDYNGYGYGTSRDGALLLISMEERDWHITTTGYGITAITDAGLEYMADRFVPYMSDGEYADAFAEFAVLCDDFVEQARKGGDDGSGGSSSAYDVGNMPKESFPFIRNLLCSLAAGLIAGGCGVAAFAAQMKSVKKQSAAGNYIRRGSMKVHQSRERYLYSNVTKTARPKQESSSSGGSSTHISSSGSSHGGGGGKF